MFEIAIGGLQGGHVADVASRRLDRRQVLAAMAGAALVTGCRGGSARETGPSVGADPEEAARRIIDVARPGAVSVAAAVVTGQEAEVVVQEGPDRATRASLFEIGSITKTMTATVLAALVLDATVALDDPISRWVDAGRNGRITLRALATHASRLPRLPPALTERRTDPRNPYADYGRSEALADLRTVNAESKSGTYSNYGFMLLGLVLEEAAGRPLGTLLAERVFAPLGMTTATTDPAAQPFVRGHAEGEATPRWAQPLAGAGAVGASVDDMLAYLRAQMAPPAGAGGDAIRMRHREELAWIDASPGVRWHNGGTGGFSSMLAFSAGLGVVLLAAEADLDEGSDRGIIDAVKRG